MNTSRAQAWKETMLNSIISSVISNALTAALDKSIQNKTLKMAGEGADALNEIRGEGEYTLFVSGYYIGLSFKIFTKFVVGTLVFCIVMMCIFDQADAGIITVCVLLALMFPVFRAITAKRMMIVAYRKGEIVIMNRKNELICRMPSSAIYDAEVTRSKVIIPWNSRKYIIRRDVRDNDGAVKKMLEFYRFDMMKI